MDLLDKYEKAKTALFDSIKNNSFSHKERNKRDRDCGKVYQELVQAGLRLQLKKKYRG